VPALSRNCVQICSGRYGDARRWSGGCEVLLAEPLADRLVAELANANGASDESLLAIADFLIILHEVDYQPSDGSLPKAEFEKVFRSFLKELAEKLWQKIDAHRDSVSADVTTFWKRVEERCRGYALHPAEPLVGGQPGSNTGFLRAERNLLENHRWTYSGGYWNPPSK
jgi:hypothetical protein